MASPIDTPRDDARRLAGLILLRALIASALFGAALLAGFSTNPDETFTRTTLFAYLSAAFISAALEFLWVLGGRRLALLAYLHAGVEAGLAAWLVALTGGVESPFIFLLLIATVLGAVAAGSGGAFVAAALASGGLFAMAIGVSLPGLEPASHGADARAAVVLVSAGGCFATAALASYLAERLRRAGRELSAREGQLRELGALYLKVAQSLRSGLLTLGPAPANRPGSAVVTLLNDPGAAILGIRADEAQGRPLRESVPALARAMDADLTGAGRSEIALQQGPRHLLLGFSLSPLKVDGGDSQGSVLTFQDLTAQRKLEEALRRQTHLASLGELAAGLAHEIRNPLAALSGAAQMLQQTAPAALPADDVKLFEVIQRETSHLETLVSDFLTFARPPAPALEAGDLGELVLNTFEAFRAGEQIGPRQLTCAATPTLARFDTGQLRQVIWNLLRNALEATAPDGSITVRVQESDGAVRIEVQDDGPGIPSELRDRIFEPFFTTKERGTGLGLALVGRIVGAHGGSIEVDSGGSGTQFTVTLPKT